MVPPVLKHLRVWISVILVLQGLVLLVYLSLIQTPITTPAQSNNDVTTRHQQHMSSSDDVIVVRMQQRRDNGTHPDVTNASQSETFGESWLARGGGNFSYMVVGNKSRGRDVIFKTQFEHGDTDVRAINASIQHEKTSKASIISTQFVVERTFPRGFKNTGASYNFASNIHRWMKVAFRTSPNISLHDNTREFFHVRKSEQEGGGHVLSTCFPAGSKAKSLVDSPKSSLASVDDDADDDDDQNTDNDAKYTDDALAFTATGAECQCLYGWLGRHCSIPSMVVSSGADKYLDRIRTRYRPRRIINALTFNMEFELLEARLYELQDAVDVFIIYESNYTLYGDPKPLRLLKRLLDGYLKEFHHQIVYVFNGKFPLNSKEEGWLPEKHARAYLGREGMKRIFGARPDDLFIYTDADEIPSREALLFLKLHDGYPEPFGASLRWSVFGFFWRQSDTTRIIMGSTYGMFRYVFEHDAQKLRSGDYDTITPSLLRSYVDRGATLQSWLLADDEGTAGWHCSWCSRPNDIRIKLSSAINADFPRWGSFPEKLDLAYISNLIRTGTWFDDVTKVGELVNATTDGSFAPEYIMQHKARYKHLIDIKAAG